MTLRRIYVPLAVAAALIVTVTLCVAAHRPKPVPQPVNAILNETLTNAMSDSVSLRGIDREVREFMQYWRIQGISLSVMRNDSLMFSKGYGWADKEKKEEMTPRHILRLASVSKLVTATGIMKLEEQGRLSLDDRVFGPDGILCDSLWTALIRDSLYYDITVEHLLRHKGGFSTRGGDPAAPSGRILNEGRRPDVQHAHHHAPEQAQDASGP